MCLVHHLAFEHHDGGAGFAEPGVGPSYGPDRPIRIVHVGVKLWFEPEARRFRGEARFHVAAAPIATGTLRLDLDEVTVDAVTGAAGEARVWRHDEGALVVEGIGDEDEIVVRWHGENPQRGLYFTGPTPREPDRGHSAWTQCQDEDAHFVLPCLDHPSVKHPWSVELHGPLGMTLLGNGRQVGQGERDGLAWARFEQAEPMPAYLFTAVCAKLDVVEDSWEGRPVRYLVPVGTDRATVARAMGKTPAMMALFSQRTGVPFPWPRYDQVVVHDFVFGGMENVACTTMVRALLVDEGAAIEWDAETLVAHELAHQWFGDLVTCQDWSQAWLNESWATHAEAVWIEHDRSPAEAAWYRYHQFLDYQDEASGRYTRPIVSYDFREPIDVFDKHLYEKGAGVLAMLRFSLGEEAFWGGVQRYLERHREDTVHSRHFQRAMEDATGKNLDRFFHQFVLSPGHAELEVSLGEEPGLLTVGVKQTQSGSGVPEAYHLGLRLEILGEDGSVRTLDLPVRERERTFAIPREGAIRAVRVDPGFRVLAEITLKGPRGWLERLIDDACPVLALRAARALAAHGGRLEVAAVIRGLGTQPSADVRGAVAEVLAKRGGVEMRDALLAALTAETHPRARRALCDALGRFRDTAVADAMLAELASPLTNHHLGAALVTLGRTRDPRAIAAITPHLGARTWADLLAQRAVAALAATGDAHVVDILIEQTRLGDNADRVRAAAARALAAIVDDVPLARDRAVERIVALVREPGYRAQLGAIGALALLRDPRSLAVLADLHQSAPDGRTRRLAYEAMIKVRAGRTGEEALVGMRKRMDELTESSNALRGRIDRLERAS